MDKLRPGTTPASADRFGQRSMLQDHRIKFPLFISSSPACTSLLPAPKAMLAGRSHGALLLNNVVFPADVQLNLMQPRLSVTDNSPPAVRIFASRARECTKTLFVAFPVRRNVLSPPEI